MEPRKPIKNILDVFGDRSMIVIDSYKQGRILTALRCSPGATSQKYLRGVQNNNYRVLNHIIAFTAIFPTSNDGTIEELLSIEGDNGSSYGIIVRKIGTQRIIYRIYDSGGGTIQLASPVNSIISDGSTRHRIVIGNDNSGNGFINIDGSETTGTTFSTVRWTNEEFVICRRVENGGESSSNAFDGFIYDFQYAAYSSENKTKAINSEIMDSPLVHIVTDERPSDGSTANNKGSEGDFNVVNYEAASPNETWVRRDNLQPF